ncbi:MAG: hypothetical protein HQK61_02670 [Desulfamplus sp.]|nr:hypothetical protein [Desulfamplus sp.]
MYFIVFDKDELRTRYVTMSDELKNIVWRSEYFISRSLSIWILITQNP